MSDPKERSYSAQIKSTIESLGLGLYCLVDSILKISGRSPDIIIKKDGNPILIIEVKRPEVRPVINDPVVFNQVEEYFDEVKKKPEYKDLNFIATHNLRQLMLFKFNETGPKKWEIVHQIPWKILPEAEVIADYENNFDLLKERFKEFLLDFLSILEGKKRQPEEEIVRKDIADLIQKVAKSSVNHLLNQYKKDSKFKEKFITWRSERFIQEPANDEKLKEILLILGSEFAYTLTLKFMFYHILRVNIPDLHEKLSDFEVRGKIKSITFLKNLYNGMFQEVINETNDFEIVFQINFSDDIPVSKDTIAPLMGLFNYIREINWRNLEHDVIGRIFEKLIYDERRHLLGQYYTRSDVVDIILAFCIKTGNEKLLEPCCGSGTFLIRAYQRINYLNSSFNHAKILTNLIGIEIEKFPAMLSVINLCIRDPEKLSAPFIANVDFFEDIVKPNEEIISFKKARTLLDYITEKPHEKSEAPELEGISLSKEEYFKFIIPMIDVVVANPPYTRQEEMEKAFFSVDYKTNLIGKTVEPLNVENWSGKASIYTYFFLKSHIFLNKNKKRLGYITSNSWLDTVSGIPLQKFFLKNDKIIAIIESEKEKWFEDADIITAITILEKSNKKGERNNHFVKFVSLKMPLTDLIGNPPMSKDYVEINRYWKNLEKAIEEIETFEKWIDANDEKVKIKKCQYKTKNVYIYEDNRFRILMIKQKDLSHFTKWGIFIRAPAIFFEILQKGKDNFKTITELNGSIRRGFTTNANELYYLPSNHWNIKDIKKDFIEIENPIEGLLKIPRKYIKKLLKSPQELDKYLTSPDNSKIWILYFHMNREDITDDDCINYIEWMEKFIVQSYINNIHRFPTLLAKFFAPELRKRINILKSKKVESIDPKNILVDIAKDWLKEKEIEINENWFKLPWRESADFLLICGLNDRFSLWINDTNILEDKRLYGLNFDNEIDNALFGIILNQTFTYLSLELTGRTNLGQGALDITVDDYYLIPLLDPVKIPEKYQNDLIKTYNKMINRTILPISQEIEQDDRKEIDEILLCKVLGLKKKKINELYEGLKRLVENRLTRGKS